MDTRERILNLLSDGAWHSGERIAAELGVSRAAVWKQASALEDLGLEVHAVRGKGYRLATPVELLQASKIRDYLTGDTTRLEVLLSVDSTNRHLLEQEGDDPAVCFAEHQSAGRGRRGRRWHSPFGGNLYMSVSWHFADTPPGLAALGLAVGAGTAGYLRDMGLADVGLKWPNDIYWRGRKLGGILIEHRGESGGQWHAVVGLGLNLRMSREEAINIEQPWVDLATAAYKAGMSLPGRNALAGSLAHAVLEVLACFQHAGFPAFRQAWSAFDVLRDQAVRVIQDDGEVLGIARGISEEGALWVESGGNRHRYVSGEVSLRLA